MGGRGVKGGEEIERGRGGWGRGGVGGAEGGGSERGGGGVGSWGSEGESRRRAAGSLKFCTNHS